MNPTICIICGARCRSQDKYYCDDICRRAGREGRSRYAQLTAEARAMQYPSKPNDSRFFDRPFPNIGGQ